MVKNLAILGSTGSIGRQSLEAAAHLGIPVCAIAANRDIRMLEQQARQFSPRLVSVYDPSAAAALRIALADTPVRVLSGPEGLIEAATAAEADCVITAVSGSVGLEPTLAAMDEKKRIGLANKETLVCAGSIVMQRAFARGAEIVPVDSEHSAIFQSLGGQLRHPLLRRILLTASGGPFRGMTREETYGRSAADALRHPNWTMGPKITVDSATLMNKGLEFIEAMHLFGVRPEQITVLIHPESALHSAVEFCDGSILGQMGVPNMGLPIQYAMTYPERAPSLCAPLELTALGALHFSEPDWENTPCLTLAVEAAKRGGSAPCVLSAANEAAVGLFLRDRIPFGRICECAAQALARISWIAEPSLEELKEADRAARTFVTENF